MVNLTNRREHDATNEAIDMALRHIWPLDAARVRPCEWRIIYSQLLALNMVAQTYKFYSGALPLQEKVTYARQQGFGSL